MDVFLLILGLILCITGIIGSFTPIIPGPLSSWLGILIIHFTSYIPFSNKLLITTFLIAFIVFLLDIFIPIIGLKKLGGSKNGLIGATIGLILGLFIGGPFGLILGAFLGALSGEFMDKTNFNGFKACIRNIYRTSYRNSFKIYYFNCFPGNILL